jgi:hypothetical protein
LGKSGLMVPDCLIRLKNKTLSFVIQTVEGGYLRKDIQGGESP